ncbi:MAG: SAM-dependent methyltransferase [Campylobacteraceae bacterium]|nr:SAM-dependent methyltransferase [Campylobacteraceae bacterium]
MQEWLYSKDGYYSTYKEIGKEGDFYTSVSTSSFFGGAIAKKIVNEIENGNLKNNTTIVEIGAHYGYLLADIIQFIYTLKPTLLKTLNFAIVERFENLQNIQKQYLEESFGNEINLVHYKDISEVKLDCAFLLANEIFDAFPCELILEKEEILYQGFIEKEKIVFEECEDEKLLKHCKKYSLSKGEVCLDYEEFIKTICTNIDSFHFLTFDYGDRFYRNDFSARIYKEHKVVPLFDEKVNLSTNYKNSDITYDVCFNYLIDIFEENNIKDIKFNTQMNTLVDFGIIDLLEILKTHTNETTYLKELQKVKLLIEPTGMGDRFKTLYVKK